MNRNHCKTDIDLRISNHKSRYFLQAELCLRIGINTLHVATMAYKERKCPQFQKVVETHGMSEESETSTLISPQKQNVAVAPITSSFNQ